MLVKLIKFSKLLQNVVNTSKRHICGLQHNLIQVDTKFHQQFVRVTILGGDTPTGEALAFLLKQNPLVSQIYLYGEGDVYGIAADLRHVDTRSKVRAFSEENGLLAALRRADIVVLMGLDKCPIDTDLETVMRQEAGRVFELAVACTKYAPKSIIVVTAPPVSATTTLVGLAFKETHWYHPGRIIGSASLHQTRANILAARYQGLDPTSVQVPLIGGPDPDCIVPLFSRCTPISLLPSDCGILYKHINAPNNPGAVKTPTPCTLSGWCLSEAYSLNQLITTIGMGLCGDARAICSAFVRQNIIANCRHLVTQVKFGPGGVIHNYGIPKLRKREINLLEAAAFKIKRREKLAISIRKQLKTRTKTQLSSLIKLSTMSKAKRDEAKKED